MTAALFGPLALTGLGGCAGTQAYVEWRPGLSAMDFDGVFEISLAEYEAFADEGEPYTRFNRYTGESKPEAAGMMSDLGHALATAGSEDPRGYAIVGLTSDGQLTLRGDGGRELTGPVDWFAITPAGDFAVALSQTRLAVAIAGASTGIDLGSLLDAGMGAYAYLMVIVDNVELTVFALPAIGGVVNANESGYVLSFRHRPGAQQPWDVSVARVSVSM